VFADVFASEGGEASSIRIRTKESARDDVRLEPILDVPDDASLADPAPSRHRRGRPAGQQGLGISFSAASLTMWRPLGVTAALTAAISTAALTAASTTASHRPAVDCKVRPGAHLALTRSYRFLLHIGHVENMFMPYQVRSSHPRRGEVMLRGRMVIPTHGPLHHLEVHICLKETRVVVTDANPTIVLTDNTTHGLPRKLPVAVMQGIGAGRSDLHYGNNVAMPHHHQYTVTVTCNRQRATFRVTAP
jgi:hypothetical protein